MECNIDSISEEKLIIMKKYGINRVSVGVESFNDSVIKFLGRNHDKKMVFEKIGLVKKYFDNINIDLIYAAYDDINILKSDIDCFLELDIPHISTYSLIIEDNTVLKINNTKNIDLDATIANLDVTKFNESVRYSLLTIKKNFPLATVFVSLPLQCMKEETVSTSKLVDDIRKMAKRCGCLVIESTSESGIIPEGNFYNSDKEGITLLDGLHPNASGQKLLARCILKELLTKFIDLVKS